MNNVVTNYFLTEKKLTPKLAQLQKFLFECDIYLEYKVGKMNVVAYILKRKAEQPLERMPPKFKWRALFLHIFKKRCGKMLQCNNRIFLTEAGKSQRFWLRDDFLITKGGCVFILKWGNLYRELLKKCHDTLWTDHHG